MTGLDNSGIKETKEALNAAIEEIKELEKRIAELEALADPLTKALYDEMSKRHTEVCEENASLTERIRRWETGGNNMTLDAKNEEIARLRADNISSGIRQFNAGMERAAEIVDDLYKASDTSLECDITEFAAHLIRKEIDND